MNGRKLIDSLRQKLADGPKIKLQYEDTAERLGISEADLRKMEATEEVELSAVAELIKTARDAARGEIERSAVRPIAEFFRLERVLSPQGVRYELFSVRTDAEDEDHPYYAGLRSALQASHGVYLFYDSRGRALYSGKAKKLSLWAEMNKALNRDRGEVQKLKLVRHPERRVSFRSSADKFRQIVPRQLDLHQMAAYFSAYKVNLGLIDVVESVLIRGFANDLLRAYPGRACRQAMMPKAKWSRAR